VTHQRRTIEETGARLARQVLRSDNEEMTDLCAQRGVAFDRLGELEQFSELKVYDGPEPAVISLTGDEARRCFDDQFFIVVVSEVHRTGQGPAVRVIAPAHMSIQSNDTDGHDLVIGSGPSTVFNPVPPFPIDVVPLLLDAEDDIKCWVSNYFSNDESVGFTGRFFEQMIQESDPYRLTPWDIAAVSTLSVDVPPAVSAKILLPGPTRDRINALVALLPPTTVSLTHASPVDVGDNSKAAELYSLLREFRGMGPTTVSKLLAAKRPALIPIRDSVVEDLLGAGQAWWRPMQLLADDERLRVLIDRVCERVPANVTYLRRLDVVLWSFGTHL